MEIVICDSSTLIRLQKFGILHYLEKIFDKAYIPDAVKNECVDPEMIKILSSSFFEVKSIKKTLFETLGLGEREAISLALELGVSDILLDDKKARNKAISYNLNVIDSSDIIITLKEMKIIDSAKAVLDRIKNKKEQISEDFYMKILTETGEI